MQKGSIYFFNFLISFIMVFMMYSYSVVSWSRNSYVQCLRVHSLV